MQFPTTSGGRTAGCRIGGDQSAANAAKHTCLHGTRRDSNDLGDLFNRSLMVVDQVNDLAMGGRQLCQTLEQDLGLLLILDGCWPNSPLALAWLDLRVNSREPPRPVM
jgi:hypothetical protein